MSSLYIYTQSEIRIVGASAWNPPPVSTKKSGFLTPKGTPNNTTTATSLSSESAAISSPSKSADFLLVTYSGTHVRCSAPTPVDKDIWLSALHSGLEGNILENRIETLAVLSKQRRLGSSNDKRQQQQQKQKQPVSKIESFEETNRSCQGLRTRTKSGMLVQSAIDTAILAFESEMSVKTMVPPLPQVEARNARLAHLKKRNGSVHSYESYGIMTTGSEAQSTIC